MEKEIRLTSEVFYALLQGKKLEQITNGERLTIYPPHYGLYLTHEQLVEIKKQAYREGAINTVELLSNLSPNKENERCECYKCMLAEVERSDFNDD